MRQKEKMEQDSYLLFNIVSHAHIRPYLFFSVNGTGNILRG